MRDYIANKLFTLANYIATEKKVIHRYKGKRTHCKHGHVLDETNIYTSLAPDGRVKRSCRTCVLARSTAYNQIHPKPPKELDSYTKGTFKFQRIDGD